MGVVHFLHASSVASGCNMLSLKCVKGADAREDDQFDVPLRLGSNSVLLTNCQLSCATALLATYPSKEGFVQ